MIKKRAISYMFLTGRYLTCLYLEDLFQHQINIKSIDTNQIGEEPQTDMAL